ncbi:MAG: Arm DNA-binding domain-containing protein [Bacteroidia bacterium]|nr:Arm DNA-binding domain-containing protein [Bacteroidia bacterium]
MNDCVKSDGKCIINIRLSHDRKVRYLKTPYCIEPNLLVRDGRIKQRHPNYIELNAALTMLLNEYNSIIASISLDIRYMAIENVISEC